MYMGKYTRIYASLTESLCFSLSPMEVTVTCYSATNFGIFVNGIFQTNYTDITGDFKPETYSLVVPETTDFIEFLYVDHR